MSESSNSAWPFGEISDEEGLDIEAIFKDSTGADQSNPFASPVETAVPAPASEAQEPTVESAEPVPAPNPAAVSAPARREPETPAAPAPKPAAAPPAEKPAPEQPEVSAAAENPIAAAFEQKTAENTKKGLLEKPPVFYHKGVKEEIEDASMTFEELRIRKSEDFTDLEEGKRVSWSVEYCGIRKEIKDPRINPMTSVVTVEVAPDLKTCKAYISVLGDEASQQSTMKGLKSAEGYIRRLDHRDIFNMKQFQHVPRLPSEWVSAGGLQHFPDLLAEGLRTGVVLHDHEDRVLPCQRAHHAVDIHVIQGLASAAGQTGQRLEYHDVLGAVHAGDALMEDGAQLVRNVQTGTAAGNRVFVGAVARRLLHQMKLLDVPGNGGLGGGEPPQLQLSEQLLLRLDAVVCDKLQNFFLAF